MFFFFKQKTAYEMRISDWSSDVCSSDLQSRHGQPRQEIRGCDLARDGHRRGRRSVEGRRFPQAPAVRRARQDHDLRLVLRRLYDAQAAGKDQGRVRGRGRGGAGDRLEALRDELRSAEDTSELQLLIRIS